jgi:hypothetical protein
MAVPAATKLNGKKQQENPETADRSVVKQSWIRPFRFFQLFRPIDASRFGESRIRMPASDL